jgi:ABC-type ATPase with predicted acetyltransferase domain
VAVGVVSYPTLAHRERERILRLKGMSNEARARFVNEHVRTISRVAVHPTFRSLGLAGVLVKCILYHCSTRYVEAMAVMGRAHPFFELAGMKRVPAGDGEEERPVYYLYDRLKQGRGRWEHGACDVVMGVG